MTNRLRLAMVSLSVLLCAALTNQNVSAQGKGQRSVRTVFTQILPARDGGKLVVHAVEVDYSPGAAPPPHSHPCPVIGYVLEGAIRTQVKGEQEAIYKSGESFYEAANGVHLVSANASETAAAKLLALFVCDHDAPLSSDAQGEAK